MAPLYQGASGSHHIALPLHGSAVHHIARPVFGTFLLPPLQLLLLLHTRRYQIDYCMQLLRGTEGRAINMED